MSSRSCRGCLCRIGSQGPDIGTTSWGQVVRDFMKVSRGGQEPSNKTENPHSSQKGVDDRGLDGSDGEELMDDQTNRSHHHTGTAKTQ